MAASPCVDAIIKVTPATLKINAQQGFGNLAHKQDIRKPPPAAH